MLKIITTYVYPPIPIRQFDWQAHYDNEADEQMSCGHGRTEAEAIADLLDNHPRCKDRGGYVGARGECMLCDADQGIQCRYQCRRDTKAVRRERWGGHLGGGPPQWGTLRRP